MIGSPKINVVSCANWISLGASLPPSVDGNTAHLAFRPEAVGITASGDGRLNGVVASIENLGSDIFAALPGKSHHRVVDVDSDRRAWSRPAFPSMPPEIKNVFDRTSLNFLVVSCAA
jgi:ABC-type sugar transport system ATPase subunit